MASNEQPGAVPSPSHLEDITKIFSQLLAEEPRYAPLVIQTNNWLESNSEQVGEFPKAWMASKVLTYVENEIIHRALPAQSEEWTEQLFASPVATQVSVVLHQFCGYSPEQVGELTNRSLEQVEAMLDSVESVVADAPPPPPLSPFSQQAPDVPQETPDVPQETPDVPQETPDVPQEAPDVPQEAPDVPQEAPDLSQEAPPAPPEPETAPEHEPLVDPSPLVDQTPLVEAGPANEPDSDSDQDPEPDTEEEPDSDQDSDTEEEPDTEQDSDTEEEPDTEQDSDTEEEPEIPSLFGTPLPDPPAPPEPEPKVGSGSEDLPSFSPNEQRDQPSSPAPALFGTPLSTDDRPPPMFRPAPPPPPSGAQATPPSGEDPIPQHSQFGTGTNDPDHNSPPPPPPPPSKDASDGSDETTDSGTSDDAPSWAKDLEPEKSRRSIPKPVLIGAVALIVVLALVGLYLVLGPDSGSAEENGNTTGTAEVAGPVSTEPVQSVLSEVCALQTRGVGALGQDVDIDFGEGIRRFRLTVVGPDSPAAKGLIVWIPDLGEDPIESVRSAGIEPIARELDYAVVTIFPDESPGQWNVTRNENSPDDVRMISEVIDFVLDEYCIDASRVVIGGLGAGAHLAAAAACADQPHPVSLLLVGGVYGPDSCETLPRSLQVIYGSEDDFFKLDGSTGEQYDDAVNRVGELQPGAEYDLQPVEDAFGAWAARQQCAEAANSSEGDTTRTTHQNCAYGGSVNLAIVEGGEHGWIQSTDPLVKGFLNSLAIP